MELMAVIEGNRRRYLVFDDIPVLTEENGPGECPYQYKGGQDNG
jgi:hypothetical protein